MSWPAPDPSTMLAPKAWVIWNGGASFYFEADAYWPPPRHETRLFPEPSCRGYRSKYETPKGGGVYACVCCFLSGHDGPHQCSLDGHTWGASTGPMACDYCGECTLPIGHEGAHFNPDNAKDRQ